MFSLNETNRYVICIKGVDLRKGVDGLCGLIRYLSLSPHNGDVYVFINTNRTTLKLLHWERGSFVIYYKRLEKGRISHKVFIKNGIGFRTLRWDEFPSPIYLKLILKYGYTMSHIEISKVPPDNNNSIS